MFHTINANNNYNIKTRLPLYSSQRPQHDAAVQMVLCQYKPQKQSFIAEILTPIEVMSHLLQIRPKRESSTPKNRHSKVFPNMCGFYNTKHTHTPRSPNNFTLSKNRSVLKSQKTLDLSGTASNRSFSYNSARNKTVDYGSSQIRNTTANSKRSPSPLRSRNEQYNQRQFNTITPSNQRRPILNTIPPQNQNRTPKKPLRAENKLQIMILPPTDSILKTTTFSRNYNQMMLKSPNQPQTTPKKATQQRSRSNPRSKNVTFIPTSSKTHLGLNLSFA